MARKSKAELDPTEILEIDGSASQLFGSLILTVLASMGVAAAVWLNLEILTSAALIALLIGTALLVGLSVILARLTSRATGPVVTLSPEGVCDRRVSKDTISWRDITQIRPRRLQNVPVIELVLTKQAEQALTFTPFPTLLRAAGWLSRKARYTMSAHGLKTSHKHLLEALEAYNAAHNPTTD